MSVLALNPQSDSCFNPCGTADLTAGINKNKKKLTLSEDATIFIYDKNIDICLNSALNPFRSTEMF
jgi:hypothetical protein